MEMQAEEDPARQQVCIVFDINDLKKANDGCGHKTGDQLIVDAADCIRSVYGNIGSCFRIGGDEFVVLLRNLSREEVQKTFTVLEEKIERMNRGRKLPLKIAWGYAVREKGSFLTGEELFEMADADMYRKKQKMKQTEAG